MSVPKSKRGLSDLELFHNAMKLRLKITNLLLRDFGVKDKIRNLDAANGMKEYGISKEDYKTLDSIYRKYNIGRPFIERYPNWILDYFRKNILEILKNLIWNITAANTIYAVHESEVYDRRRYQTSAIINCEQLLQELQYIIFVVPSDINKLMPYVEMIMLEIRLLKGWRKSSNEMLRRIRNKESEKEEESQVSDKKKTKDIHSKLIEENNKELPWKIDEMDKEIPALSEPVADPMEVLMGSKLLENLINDIKKAWKKKSSKAAKKTIKKMIEKEDTVKNGGRKED